MYCFLLYYCAHSGCNIYLPGVLAWSGVWCNNQHNTASCHNRDERRAGGSAAPVTEIPCLKMYITNSAHFSWSYTVVTMNPDIIGVGEDWITCNIRDSDAFSWQRRTVSHLAAERASWWWWPCSPSARRFSSASTSSSSLVSPSRPSSPPAAASLGPGGGRDSCSAVTPGVRDSWSC